jgi:hypothetical protein
MWDRRLFGSGKKYQVWVERDGRRSQEETAEMPSITSMYKWAAKAKFEMEPSRQATSVSIRVDGQVHRIRMFDTPMAWQELNREEYAVKKLNLGCESQIIEGWENLDPRHDKFPGATPWQWNLPIPCDDGQAELVLVQHVLMYCERRDYAWNLGEIARALRKGGKFLLKEEDNRIYNWKPLGTKHRTGYICGATNPDDIMPFLKEAGFGNFVTDAKQIMEKYGDIINRQRKLRKGMLFAIECEKL